MKEAKAQLKTYRQSPRKVRLVAKAVRGKKVDDALVQLSFTAKRSADPLYKLISSAVANAKELSIPTENLVIKELKVDEGATLYRRRPRSRGMANPIRKRTSHVSVTLSEAPTTKKQEVKKSAKAKSNKLEATS